MYDVYVGKRKSLVFPIMCNSHVSISYSENVPDIESTPSDTTDDIPYGIWAHSGDWTVEALITPYDINGSAATLTGAGRQNRLAQNAQRAVMPANGTGSFLSEAYLATNDRYGHKMCFFKCEKFSLYLKNETTSNFNQPAEYSISIEYDSQGFSRNNSITSDPVILSSSSRSYEYGNAFYENYIEGFTEDGRIRYNFAAKVVPAQSSPSAVIDTDTSKFAVGQRVFIKENEFDYTLLGTITGVDVPSSHKITLDTATTTALPLLEKLYVDTYKEPKYIDNIHHIAVSYSSTSSKISIYYNGSLVKTANKVVFSEILDFGRGDIVIGKNTTGDVSASADCQFMGEIHELSVVKTYQKSFRYLNNLMPKFSETLLFLQFEEENL